MYIHALLSYLLSNIADLAFKRAREMAKQHFLGKVITEQFIAAMITDTFVISVGLQKSFI